MDGGTKTPVLVLCHTIFHDAFRASAFGKVDAELLKRHLQSKFIADFIIELGSETAKPVTFTSKKVFDEFYAHLEKECKRPEVYAYLELIKKLVYCVPTESINKLDINEGIIVIADILRNSEGYEPFLITDMKDKKVGIAKEYYKKYTKKADPKIPFDILNLDEAIGFLKGRYSIPYNSVKDREPLYDII